MIEKTNPWTCGANQGEIAAVRALEQAEYVFGEKSRAAVEWLVGYAHAIQRYAEIMEDAIPKEGGK